MPEEDPSLPYVRPSFDQLVADIDEALDVDLAASGVKELWVLSVDLALPMDSVIITWATGVMIKCGQLRSVNVHGLQIYHWPSVLSPDSPLCRLQTATPAGPGGLRRNPRGGREGG